MFGIQTPKVNRKPNGLLNINDEVNNNNINAIESNEKRLPITPQLQ